MPNFQPMKDLVVHMDPFWDKYSRLKPYLQPSGQGLGDHESERRVSPEDMKKLVAVANCVMCATCYALCPVVWVDPAFAGPAAIAYAYRFIEDVRDAKRKERAAQISDDYLWLCAHCYACSYCPKHVDPQDRIIAVKRATIEEGLIDASRPAPRAGRRQDDQGHRMLHETEVIQGTVGRFNIRGLIKVAPFGMRLALAGKIPPLFLKPVPKVDEIKTIFDTLEAPYSHDRYVEAPRIKRQSKSAADAQVRLLPRLRRQRIVQGAVQFDHAAGGQARHRARRVDRRSCCGASVLNDATATSRACSTPAPTRRPKRSASTT